MMPLPVPRLDDRSYSDLMADALAALDKKCPEWTDHSPSDPGITLLELFAFLTENMLYRLNRVPSKQYVTLLNLVGVTMRPPSAAAIELTFTRSGTDRDEIAIPQGTQVGSGDASVVFTVTKAVTLPKDAASVVTPALHCEQIDGELIAIGTGAPRQSASVARPPIIAPPGDELHIVVGIERAPHEESGELPTRGIGDKAFALWRRVDSFADATAEMGAYCVDLAAGRVQFGDGIHGAIPPLGREIRAWYRRGGGRAGNVAAGTLTVLKSPPLKLSVTNAARAIGGSDGETAQETIRRGPLELTSMRCAVTARDFERVALMGGGIARAHAFAQAQFWRHADPGIVEIVLVPSIDVSKLSDGGVTAAAMVEHRREELRDRTEKLISGRQPLGVRVAVGWTKVRSVSVTAHVVVTRGEDGEALAARLRQRLNALLSPLGDEPFGRTLRASDAYEALLAEPGVRYADRLRFSIGETPSRGVNDLVADPHQPRCWFAAAADALYRSLDDGDSWENVLAIEGDVPQFVRRHLDKPGLMALGALRGSAGVIHLSFDCGETWTRTAALFNCEISDAAWITRNARPLLLIATKEGLFQFQPGAGTGPASIAVDKTNDAKGYYGVTATTLSSGLICVAVAARERGGLHLSAAGGVSDSFHGTGLAGKDIRTLKMHRFNARDYLWAAIRAEAGEPGEGATRIELRGSGIDDPGGWTPFNIGWQGGSCEDLAFVGGTVFAGSNRGGTLTLDSAAASPRWQAVRLDAGLPIRDKDRLLEVCGSVAAAPAASGPIVMAGGPLGVFRSLDGGAHFALVSATEFTERVPLPPRWLYCASTHSLTLVSEESEG
jgi:hypothetical protein